MSYHRAKERNRRLKKLYNETKNTYRAGAYYNEDKKRYIKYRPSNTPGHAKYLRKMSNRRVRRNVAIPKGSTYKKLFDYWWELY